MKKPDIILDEVHAARRKLYDATKSMSTSERIAYLSKRAEATAQRYGFEIVNSVVKKV